MIFPKGFNYLVDLIFYLFAYRWICRTTYDNYFVIENELKYNQDHYIEIYSEKNDIQSTITSSTMSVINNPPFAYAYFPFENPTIYEFEPIFISGAKSFDIDEQLAKIMLSNFGGKTVKAWVIRIFGSVLIGLGIYNIVNAV